MAAARVTFEVADRTVQPGRRGRSAIAQWRLVLTAEPDNSTRAVAACHRAQARVRLRAAGGRLP